MPGVGYKTANFDQNASRDDAANPERRPRGGLSALALGAGMRLVVDLGERLEVEVGVDLRAGDARVAEHFLNRAKIAGRLQHVRRERMAQHVRVDVLGQSLLYRPLRQPALDRSRRDSRAAATDEHCFCVDARKRRAFGDPRAERGACGGADRYDSLLCTFTPDADFSLLE